MVAVFTVLTGMGLIWSIITYLHVSNAVREYLPPQFQDYENARYAFSVWALQHPTPLPVQAEYVRFVKGSSFTLLPGALACLSSGRADAMVFGVLFLAAFVYSVFYAIRCSRTYEQNCRRAQAKNDEQNQ
jgi:O-antigen ligase